MSVPYSVNMTNVARGYANGRVPHSLLLEVEEDIWLNRDAGRSYLNWKSRARADGRKLFMASPDGGYRSFATQVDMKSHPSRHNLDPRSSVSLASPGLSTHGWGDAADVWGTDLDYLIDSAKLFGWTRTFGASDPHHFRWDGKTYQPPTKGTVKHVRFRAGDTPTAVAARAGVTVARLYVLNPGMPDPTKVPVGYRVRVA